MMVNDHFEPYGTIYAKVTYSKRKKSLCIFYCDRNLFKINGLSSNKLVQLQNINYLN